MQCGLVFSILGWQQVRKAFSAAMCKWRQRSILPIPKMSDKYNTQVEASIKTKGQLYCYLSVTWLLYKVVGPAHLETTCSLKGIGQQEAMFYYEHSLQIYL